MLFILLLYSTLLDEKSVYSLQLYLFVSDRSNGVIRSTFFNTDRNWKEVGGVGHRGRGTVDGGGDEVLSLQWGKLEKRGGEKGAVVGGADGRGQQSFKIGLE